jgi:Flp pilus assembly protein CpaB
MRTKITAFVCCFLLGVVTGAVGLKWYESLDPEAQRRAEAVQRERERLAVLIMSRALEAYSQTLTNHEKANP